MATQNPYSDSLLMDAFRGSLSNAESLGRGFAVAPVGLIGDINALAREYITPRLPSQVQGLLQAAPAAPTTEQILSNIPRASAPRRESAGMEQLGAAMNPRGPVELAKAVKNMPVGLSIKDVGTFKFPQEEAIRLAQQRAALPKEQFGLGLPPNNTAQQRADAMEYINRMFHETEGKNIENGLLNFDVKRVGAAASDEQTPYAMFLKPHGENIGIARNNPTQMPVLVKSNLTDENIMQAFGSREELQNYLNQFPDIKEATKAVRDLDKQMANYMGDIEKKADALYAQGKTEEGDKLLDSLNFNSNLMKEFDARTNELAALSKEKITDLFKSKGIGTVGLTNDKGAFGRSTLTEMVLNPSENVRSVNAAFDPWRRTAATAAAMGVAAPDLLAQEQPVITQQQIDDELAMYGLLGR